MRDIRINIGLPSEEILKFALGENVDLILMNSKARKDKKERVGSTVGGIIRLER